MDSVVISSTLPERYRVLQGERVDIGAYDWLAVNVL